jgi:hypothetical protein
MSNLSEKYLASLQTVEGKYTKSLSEWPHEKQGELIVALSREFPL